MTAGYDKLYFKNSGDRRHGDPCILQFSAQAAQVSNTLKVANGSQGQYLTDALGYSLYVFESDTPNQSNCTGQCAQVWPPLQALNGQPPTAGTGVQNSLISTIQRSDGTTQVTYDGQPLYYYSLDQAPGDIRGQAINSFGNKWYLVEPNGSKLLPSGYTNSTTYSVSCDATGRCCDPNGHCFDGGFTCDGNHQCCDMFGHCYDQSANCDFSGHCCDPAGHCFDGGCSCDGNGHCCNSNGQCFNNGNGGFSCDSHGKCCTSNGQCFNFGGGTGCGSFNCDGRNHCCDSCGQCYVGGGTSTPSPRPTPSPTHTTPSPSPSPTPTPSTSPSHSPSGTPSGGPSHSPTRRPRFGLVG